MLPYLSYLRVYEPAERSSGSDLPNAGASTSDVEAVGGRPEQVTLAWEQHRSRSRVTSMSTTPGAGEDPGAYLLDLDGEAFECPADLPLRSWLSAARLTEEVGPTTAQLLAGEALEVAGEQLSAWRHENPSHVPHVRESMWGVERTWFLLVDADEREEYVVDGVLTVRFRTAMGEARARLDRASKTLSASVLDDDLARELSSLGAWLAGFGDDCVLELDYAGVAVPLGREGVMSDRSAEEIHAAVQALERGDVSTAAESYAAFQERWAAVGLHERAN